MAVPVLITKQEYDDYFEGNPFPDSLVWADHARKASELVWDATRNDVLDMDEDGEFPTDEGALSGMKEAAMIQVRTMVDAGVDPYMDVTQMDPLVTGSSLLGGSYTFDADAARQVWDAKKRIATGLGMSSWMALRRVNLGSRLVRGAY